MKTWKDKTLKELFGLLDENDAKEIVRQLYNVDQEKTKYWAVKKVEDSYQICVSDIENPEELHPDNSTIIVLTNGLDLYQQNYNFKNTKSRVGNLFITYQFMQELLSKKLETIKV